MPLKRAITTDSFLTWKQINWKTKMISIETMISQNVDMLHNRSRYHPISFETLVKTPALF